jgi:hypothetical protein
MIMTETAVDIGLIAKEVEVACRAPSLHNSQPWRWLASSTAVDLLVDPDVDIDQQRAGNLSTYVARLTAASAGDRMRTTRHARVRNKVVQLRDYQGNSSRPEPPSVP